MKGSVAVPHGIYLLASDDLNGDGVADLVVAGYRSVGVLLGLGGGNFEPAVLYDTRQFLPTYSVAVADFNHDGKADIAAVGDDCYDRVSVLVVFLGNGDGTFAKPIPYDTTYNSFSNLVVADFNGDGIPDLADSGDYVTVHLGRGDGSFLPPAFFDASTSFILGANSPRKSLAAVDINQDGNVDVLSLDYYTNILDVLMGKGDGTFQERSLFGTGPCPKSVAVADLNHDGNLDVAVPDTCDSNFEVLAGDGTGKFLTRRSYDIQVAAQPTSVAAGYLDSNQSLDLVVGDLGIGAGGGFYLFPGNNRGAFQRGAVVLVSGGAA
ncbi:MAG: VCBS repeat-containing protein [Acidobacteriales bacterium]|nr:VCBS repeat-containing protein [Terriglobales bacterium]